jgi:hypothetical protein
MVFLILLLTQYYHRKNFEKKIAKYLDQKIEYSSQKYYLAKKDFTTYILKSYKIIFFLAYTIVHISLTGGMIYMLFFYSKVLYTFLIINFSLMGLVLLLIFINIFLIPDPKLQMGIYYLKQGLYTPYILIFCSLYFWKINPVSNLDK